VNHLAHFALVLPTAERADEAVREGRIIGALLGDFVKGPLRGEWPAAWEQGIRLHRRIDALTDHHPERLLAARLLPAGYRRYAGIVLDVMADQHLSRHWQSLREDRLAEFAEEIYAVLERHRPQLPERAARMAERLIEHDLLRRYHEPALVEGILARIGDRHSRPNPLPRAGVELAPLLPQLEPPFLVYYPQLAQQVRTLLSPAE
jgi:acyl carrier protein phosphodiesterase